MKLKAVMPRDRSANLRFNERTQRWDYLVRLVRPDGSLFRRAGSAVSEAESREKRNAAYREFNNDLGVAKEEKKRTRREGANDLRGWTERVMPLIRHDCAPTTFEAYCHSLENHVLPALGLLPLEEVRSLVITEHLQKLSKELSPGVASQARSALSRVLQIAASDGRIPANPVSSVRIGARERKLNRIERAKSGETGKRWLSLSEGKHLLVKSKGTAAYMPILLGLRFGLRSGEALGLRWSDVDIAKGVMRIQQQAVCLKGVARQIVPPKSAAGVRDMPIPTDILEELTLCKANAEATGIEWVCVDAGGAPLHPKHVSRIIKDAVTSAGFDGSDGNEVPTSHDFRSSYLSWLANHANNGAGVKPHVLIALAGHTDINVAMTYYVKAGAEDLASAVNSLSL
ncbi:MAG: tyrosine-type recombinase/integrase [Armatimonadetes bacterium]|nr:tyrosine-type recombinase/integrase [Armatimonadota bacterium]